MALDYPEGGSELTRAMVAQSQALTTLVSHLTATSSDPFQDLGSTTSSLSTKGAASRAKLQTELAAQRGSFFVSVIQQMARRMQPAISPDAEMSALRDRGITPTQYRVHYLAGGLSDESYDGGQPQCRKGCSQPPVRVPGVDGHGQRQHAGGTVVISDRGPPLKPYSRGGQWPREPCPDHSLRQPINGGLLRPCSISRRWT
jgi:hypothetical protein